VGRKGTTTTRGPTSSSASRRPTSRSPAGSTCARSGASSASSGARSGRKHDQGKARFDLIPPRALLEVAQVLAHGARKYSDDNWRQVPEARKRYTAAAYRHLNAWQRGEACDAESGLSHLAHAACCLFFLMEV
jgi:hypothetical protein